MQEQEAQAAERSQVTAARPHDHTVCAGGLRPTPCGSWRTALHTQKLQRKLARHVLGSSFDAITSRSWNLPWVAASTPQPGAGAGPTKPAAGTPPEHGGTGSVSEGEAAATARRAANPRLPSLPETRALAAQADAGGAATTNDADAPAHAASSDDRRAASDSLRTPGRRRLRRSTTSDADVSTSSAAWERVRQDTDKDTDGGKGKGAREKASKLPAVGKAKDAPSTSTTGGGGTSPKEAAGGALPPGASLYYQARAAQEAQQALLARMYGAGSNFAAYMQWRRRHKIPDHVKVFSMGGARGGAWGGRIANKSSATSPRVPGCVMIRQFPGVCWACVAPPRRQRQPLDRHPGGAAGARVAREPRPRLAVLRLQMVHQPARHPARPALAVAGECAATRWPKGR